jgi:hypothetical protein
MLIYVYTVDNQDFQGILKVYYVGLDACVMKVVLRGEIMNICIDLLLLERYCMCIGRYI